MALQQIQLDQSIYPKRDSGARSPISEALTPQKGGISSVSGLGPNTFIEKIKAEEAKKEERKYQEKMMKLQHEQEMEKLKFAAGLESDVQKKMASSAAGVAEKQIQGQQKADEAIKEQMPDLAKTTWEFILGLDEEGQKFYIDKLKEKEYGEAASTISLTDEPYDMENDTIVEDKQNRMIFIVGKDGKKKAVILPGKGGGMYGEMVTQGLLDPTTDKVIREKVEGEKGQFVETKKGNVLDTKTGKILIQGKDLPEDLTSDQIIAAAKEARLYVVGMADPALLEGMDAEGRSAFLKSGDEEMRKRIAYNLSLFYGIDEKEGKRIADLMPKLEETDVFTTTITKGEGADNPLSDQEAEDNAQLAAADFRQRGIMGSGQEEEYFAVLEKEFGSGVANRVRGILSATSEPSKPTETTATKDLTAEEIAKQLKAGTYVGMSKMSTTADIIKDQIKKPSIKNAPFITLPR